MGVRVHIVSIGQKGLTRSGERVARVTLSRVSGENRMVR